MRGLWALIVQTPWRGKPVETFGSQGLLRLEVFWSCREQGEAQQRVRDGLSLVCEAVQDNDAQQGQETLLAVMCKQGVDVAGEKGGAASGRVETR